MPFRIQAVDLSVFGRQAHDRLSGGVNVPCGRFAAVRKADLYQGGIIVVEPFWSNFGDTEIRSLPNMKSILCNLGALFTGLYRPYILSETAPHCIPLSSI